jgi:hypothetical protein
LLQPRATYARGIGTSCTSAVGVANPTQLRPASTVFALICSRLLDQCLTGRVTGARLRVAPGGAKIGRREGRRPPHRPKWKF